MARIASLDSFKALQTLGIEGRSYHYFSLPHAAGERLQRLPISLRVLLENLLRHEDGESVTREDIQALLDWNPTADPSHEIQFRPSRVLLQDFTGVPAVVDLAVMRDAIKELGGDPEKINPLQPVDLVIDHSVQVDYFGTPEALRLNSEVEYKRNRERYTFLKWGQQAFKNFRVVPPDTGIIHQINLEYLARVTFAVEEAGRWWLYPDSLVGTDSHTTMINGLGVFGWGVGGIEAEAAMLGQPISMLIPQVVGFRLTGSLPPGATATDLVLTIVEMLRQKGVVGKFVEFFGPALANMRLEDMATIANMAPEYGATMGYFPVNEATLRYLSFTGRSSEQVELVREYTRAQGLFYQPGDPEPQYSDLLELDISTVEPSVAGPRRPQDRIALKNIHTSWAETYPKLKGESAGEAKVATSSGEYQLQDGAVVIAAITSCTNTSNPDVLIGAGLLARKAVERGLQVKPWVKTSLAPGSQVVPEYLRRAGLMPYLETLGFHVVGFGCTTCIGNSGPLKPEVAAAVKNYDLVVTSVLSGNRNFEGRVNPLVKANYLASPPLVVAYALAGRIGFNFDTEPLGRDQDGQPVFLRDIWPSPTEIAEAVKNALQAEQFQTKYADVFRGSEEWQKLEAPQGATYTWDPSSTYIRKPPFFEGLTLEVPALSDIKDARVLALLGDSITTDHISPAGAFSADSPAGRYLQAQGVAPEDFNSFGSRRGNHEVMMRGTFGNIRLRNQLVPGYEGGVTKKFPEGETMSIYEAAMAYKQEGTPLIVVAGKEYGTGSSRDWAAKGTALLGVKAVLAESFERIHRSNLVGMGVLPLQFMPGENAAGLGLTGEETFSITGIAEGLEPGKIVSVTAVKPDGGEISFQARVRLDTPNELSYYRHGGILQYVLRRLLQED